MLYGMVIPAMAREMHLSDAAAGGLMSATLLAAAMGFVYNIGRVASAVAPYSIGWLADRHGMLAALSVTALAFALAAVIARGLKIRRAA